MAQQNAIGATLGFEARLWAAAALRNNMDAGRCHILTPCCYVEAEAAEDDGEPFEEKMRRPTATLRQQAEAARLDAAIAANLKELGYAE